MIVGYSRRKFLGTTAKALVTAGSLAALPQSLQAKIREENKGNILENGFSVLQGLTTESSTQLSVDVPKDMHVRYRLLDSNAGREIQAETGVRATRSFSSWAVDQVHFQDLQLGVTYLFHILDEDGNVLEERELKTVDLNNRSARIALLSCMMDFNIFKEKIWDNLSKAQPDYCFFLGDNIYGDMGGFKTGPKLLWRRYIETRRSLPFYHQRRLIPVLGLWDDHDFGKNNTNHTYRHKEDSKAVFNSFFPRKSVPGVYDQGPGVSAVFRAFGQEFVFIDNRYFRDEPLAGSQSFWGMEQFNWVREEVAQNSKPKWFLQGSQFFGAYQGKGEAFEGRKYEQEFDKVMDLIRSTNAPSIFASGDVHFTEIQEVEREKMGYRSFELTASHMHSFTAPPKDNGKRRRRLVKEANFLLVDLQPVSYGAFYEVSSVRRNSEIAFKDYLQIY